ncbi:Pachytene checkpoint protein 2-like protein [Drosera capensis]
MSTPMEIIESNIEPENPKPSDPDDVVVPDSPSPPPSAADGNNGHVGGSVSLSYSYSSLFADDKFLVSVEVCLKPTSTATKEDVRVAVERMLEKRSMSYTDGPIPIPGDDPFLVEHVLSINICDTDEWVEKGEILLFWQVRPAVHVYQISEEGPYEELGGDGQLSSFNEWTLPAKEFHGMWDRCAQVAKLFQNIQEMVEEESNLVVNALLTQLDKLKSSPNVIIMTTSNITAAIDIAFVDRADIKAYIGPPTLQARYEILRSCFQELLRTGILKNATDASVKLPSYAALKGKLQSCELLGDQASLTLLKQLLEVAEACEGLSGRSLRKLPFLTHAALTNPYNCDLSRYHKPVAMPRNLHTSSNKMHLKLKRAEDE